MTLPESYWDKLDRARDEQLERDTIARMRNFGSPGNPGHTDRRIEIMVGDITELDVDAVVNAANPSLIAGGGVCGAIHHAAGDELQAACDAIAQVRPGVRCPTGESRITPGFRLKARHVIHTVGPVWEGHGYEPELLAMCYRSAMKIARQYGLTSIAFPAISTGVYGFPREQAARIAVREVREILDRHDQPGRVVFVCFSETDRTHYENALRGAK